MPSKNQAQSVRKDELRMQAVHLRGQRMTYDQIAEALGISTRTARRYIDQGREMANDRTASKMDEIRDQQVAEMRRVQQAGWGILERMQTEDGQGVPVDYKAAAALGQVVSASARIARLCGVDAPVQVSGSFAVEMDEDEAKRIWEEEHGSE